MRQDWLKDLLAVADTGSILSAAAARGVTQPAFSRRLRQIEQDLGTELFDRSRRPTQMLPHVLACLDDIRDVSDSMTDLASALRQADRGPRNRLEVACQHAIAVSVLPTMLEPLWSLDLEVAVRCANREDCLAQLLVGQADLVFVYETVGETLVSGLGGIDRSKIADDKLIPVATPSLRDTICLQEKNGELPIVTYPRDVFLGQAYWQHIAPQLSVNFTPLPKIETALTAAARQFARAGQGVAWLPNSLVAEDLQQGDLIDLGSELPEIALSLVMLRRSKDTPMIVKSAFENIRVNLETCH